MPDVTKYEKPFKDAMADLRTGLDFVYVDHMQALKRIISLLDDLNTRLEALEGDLRRPKEQGEPVQLIDPYSPREG
jgi:hypothetical protein